ncbi:MAG TPA: maltotransferase domain-containing protein [Stellaceae bacterium]|jgi:starch synthase (maltosyl-transferring)|nr:maltotransferase domain-containing protein [Stellaceae bacterium]
MAVTRLYYLHPLLAGPVDAWARQMDRAAAMLFDTVAIAPPFATGRAHDLFLTADHDRLDDRLGAGDAATALARFARECRDRGLQPMLDVVVDRVAVEHATNGLASWYRRDCSDELPDPRQPPQRPDVAMLSIDADWTGAVEWWTRRFASWAEADISHFRCLRPQHVPPAFWTALITEVRRHDPHVRFMASAFALQAAESELLAECGFDFVDSCSRTWDYRTEDFLEQLDHLARIASVIAMPEAPFDRRLSRAFRDTGRAQRAARRAIALATSYGAGWLMPMGFEFGAARDMDAARDRPEDFARVVAEPAFDLTAEITAANSRSAALDEGAGALVRGLSPPEAPVAALLVTGTPDGRANQRPLLVLANASLDASVRVPIAPLLMASGLDGAVLDNDPAAAPLDLDGALVIAPAEVRTLCIAATPPIPRPEQNPVEAATMPRVAIENVMPTVDDGRFPAKRLVGETVEVSADLISDGHDQLAAALLWRSADEKTWREAPMAPAGNDRWAGRFPLNRVGRYLFTVLAWKDRFGNFTEELEKKYTAGLPIELELEEGRLLIENSVAQVAPDVAPRLDALAKELKRAEPEERRRRLLSPATAALMASARLRPHAHQHPIEYAVEAERRVAGFGSWYELFPRSQSGDPSRHGTFTDVIARLPAISAMGFDVLYFPPIHPIGRVNRKGHDNAPHAEPGEPGSPYAIGSEEGGHEAIHPALGTLDDFRRLRDAAARHGMELALDFAVQCAPDHPWLRQHPDWFDWRPDGSIRYAENPPKKYEDIVNVDFYAGSAVPSLWLALRDIVLLWAGEGVRLFRVDNPHTKPLPFWEWMIGEVRAKYPDAVFLAEAFTRPKLMYRLAKIGFSQSYTYFTWRNTKAELTEYLTELTTNARDFFRPHFFVNTPDINPVFLQTSGRPGFLIRASLAATLSGLFGVYSGFELCEARALPGREEYASSEKYEIRAWDWEAPGNIIAEITRLNRIRRANPALQTHLGVSFHNAFNDQVLYFSKATPDLQNVVLVAVNLDPRFPQECDIEVPLWLWGLSDAASVAVADLMDGHRFTWTGKMQHIRLDPAVMPFAIWRLRPAD